MPQSVHYAEQWVPPAHMLVRRCREGVLATQSQQWAGFPYASYLPCVCDETGSPLFVISTLAEHTQNLQVDRQCSFVVFDSSDPANAAERVTLIGTAEPITPSPLLAARIKRYQPQAVQFLALGDFAVWRLEVSALRYIAGFGRMGWSDARQWADTAQLSLEQEAQWLDQINAPSDIRLIGIDFDGVDVLRNGKLIRYGFDTQPLGTDALRAAVTRALSALSPGQA
ncbi:HugZ family pyridoxamine 5'-phosphate oxidase [Silvimonas amylolytica]|uniref:CREG-like beta-barrel domain-containing protein n=1 Tax=Silvimonas amylolytica TaxID=449663 RepID=A0ABQ2PJB4_9NEIS|nr:pyridoxamine 5'-phosphate oxidase family protein [Silvimonas amylolytica]GGP25562.1 hypothetical protein GCM10010971_13810 [Silvimonas amylolytica]